MSHTQSGKLRVKSFSLSNYRAILFQRFPELGIVPRVSVKFVLGALTEIRKATVSLETICSNPLDCDWRRALSCFYLCGER